MSYGRLRAENQLFFLNTGKIEGIQSYSITDNFGDFGLKYIGIGNKGLNQTINSYQYADLTLESYLLEEDILVQQTGNTPINCFILNGQNDNNPYSLTSGYLTSYSARYTNNQIPQINSSFRFYSNVGNIYTGNLDSNSITQLNGIKNNIYAPFNGQIGNSNYVNLTINESTGNRVIDFGFSVDINRLPIYNIGYPPFKRCDTIYPINISCDITFEVDELFSDVNLFDFPINKMQQNIEIDVYSNSYNNIINKYMFFNMTLVSNRKEINVDGNLTIIRKYIGQLFNPIDLISGNNNLDFGFVASGINFFIDWGFVNQAFITGLDFGTM